MKKSDSIFTPALTKALKARRSVIQCQTDGGYIYISDGFFLVKLLPSEYDEFVRPVAQRDPGSWTIDEKGQPTERKPFDMARFLSDFDNRTDLSAMVKAPFTFSVELTRKFFTVTAFYNTDNGFVSFFDTKYTAMVSFDRVTLSGASPTSPIIVHHNGSPSALLLPMRVENPALTAAVQAYFTETQPKAKTAAPDPPAFRRAGGSRKAPGGVEAGQSPRRPGTACQQNRRRPGRPGKPGRNHRHGEGGANILPGSLGGRKRRSPQSRP